MDDPVRCFTEDSIPYLLHGCTSDLDIVLEVIILPSDVHHESRDENAMPVLTINLVWEVLILEFLVVCRFGCFNHECLV